MGWEAYNREDLDACFMLYHPDCQSTWDSRFPSVGIESTIEGREERIRVQRRILDEWDELRFEPEAVIQFGDRLMSIGRMTATGLRSGAVVDTEWAATFTIRGGQVVHEDILMDHRAALAAAGLSDAGD